MVKITVLNTFNSTAHGPILMTLNDLGNVDTKKFRCDKGCKTKFCHHNFKHALYLN